MQLETIYARPYRVYICFLLLIIAGMVCYSSMPVALFPNAAKPRVIVWVPYDNFTKAGFLNSYGKAIESNLKKIQAANCEVERVEAKYQEKGVEIAVIFKWGNDANTCCKEVEQKILYYKSQWPENMRYGSWVYLDQKDVGFYLGSFYSDKRSAQEIHDILDDLISPKIAGLKNVDSNELYNPSQTQITLTLDPLKMAAFKLLPDQVSSAVQAAVKSYSGGVLHQNAQTIIVEVAAQSNVVQQIAEILIPIGQEHAIMLSEIADVTLKENAVGNRIFKVNGEASIILFVTPVIGKNIKTMCDQVQQIVADTLALDSVPKDIKYVTLINPGNFIKAAISNVMHEVWLCSFIAVLILFAFIGSVSGTVTTLLEIPISIILSFILMKLTNIQLNLISLGGLALSVGMNVDASVVVIDAIIKKLSTTQYASKADLCGLVASAVRSVMVPIVLATITSLIVFIPLIFTSELTYALLGDLAKTVIYSHALSLCIALIIVPTLRIHLITAWGLNTDQHAVPQLHSYLVKLYNFYVQTLQWFLNKNKLQYTIYIATTLILGLSLWLIPKRLNHEIICPPDTDIIITVLTYPESSHINQMENVVAEYERNIQDKFGKDIEFFFANIYKNDQANEVIILRDKSKFKAILAQLQEFTKGSSNINYFHIPYNPSELPIPKAPDWRVAFFAKDELTANNILDHFRIDFLDSGITDNINSGTATNAKYLVQPYTEIFEQIQRAGYKLTPADLGKILMLSNKPIAIARLTINNKEKEIVMLYPEQTLTEDHALTSIPVALGSKVVPLRSVASFKLFESEKTLLRIDGEAVFRLEANFTEQEKKYRNGLLAQITKFTADFSKNTLPKITNQASVKMVDAQEDLTKAISELLLTTGLSLILIFMVIYLRFASILHTLIIMLAIPFGILGGILALYLCNSTISLNSALGVILLNGITVANSIMLVERILTHFNAGKLAQEAIILTAQERIRPILMTSIITILGMLPIALGLGTGAKVLQPLGIVVSGGLWVSLIFTLYVIPALTYKILHKA